MTWRGAGAGKVTAQPLADGRLQWGRGSTRPISPWPGDPGQPRSQEGPVALAARGGYASAGGQLAFEELHLVTRYASFDATGQVADATGRRVADLQGSLAPNWQTLNAMFVARPDRGPVPTSRAERRGRSGSKGRSRLPRWPSSSRGSMSSSASTWPAPRRSA